MPRDDATLVLDQRPLWKTFLVFLGPLLLSNILQSLSGTINNVYLGQMIGVKALAGIMRASGTGLPAATSV